MVYPYHHGELITPGTVPPPPSWQIGLGSDGEWGFGYVSSIPHVWALNGNNEYITLIRIPNPTDQPR